MSNELTYKKKILVFAITSLIWVAFHIVPVVQTLELNFILITGIGMFVEVMIMLMILDFIMTHKWRKTE